MSSDQFCFAKTKKITNVGHVYIYIYNTSFLVVLRFSFEHIVQAWEFNLCEHASVNPHSYTMRQCLLCQTTSVCILAQGDRLVHCYNLHPNASAILQ